MSTTSGRGVAVGSAASPLLLSSFRAFSAPRFYPQKPWLLERTASGSSKFGGAGPGARLVQVTLTGLSITHDRAATS